MQQQVQQVLQAHQLTQQEDQQQQQRRKHRRPRFSKDELDYGGLEKSDDPFCNPFLVLQPQEAQPMELEPGPASIRRPPQTLYGVHDQSEILDDGTVAMTFGTVDGGTWFQTLLGTNPVASLNEDDLARFYATIPLYLLEIRVGLSDFGLFAEATPLLFSVGAALDALEGTWVRIDLAEGAGLPADLYFNLFADPIPTGITSVTPAGARESALLEALDPLANKRDATEAEIAEALDLDSPIDEIAIYDVGQGAANGLISGHEVQCYFDFGGGVAGNRKTFPTALKFFCRCVAPPIILSHWDHDHWSAQGRRRQFRTHTWIVPRQHSAGSKRAPHHSSLIAAILKVGRIVVFPSKSSVTVGQLIISECTGSTKNTSGLALVAHPPSTSSGELPVLMTADAGYGDLFNSVSSNPDFDAIVCPHHGGRSNSPTIPAPPSWTYQRLIYSYGPGNTYKHPLPATYNSHDYEKWYDARVPSSATPIVRNTADRTAVGLGHVGFDWDAHSAPAKLACGGLTDLDAQQK
jgi:hypothetical protein